jgi:hypothetical protein
LELAEHGVFGVLQGNKREEEQLKTRGEVQAIVFVSVLQQGNKRGKREV